MKKQQKEKNQIKTQIGAFHFAQRDLKVTLNFTTKLHRCILHVLLVVLIEHFILGHSEVVLPVTNFSCADGESQEAIDK